MSNIQGGWLGLTLQFLTTEDTEITEGLGLTLQFLTTNLALRLNVE
jgi:hypothetical protein